MSAMATIQRISGASRIRASKPLIRTYATGSSSSKSLVKSDPVIFSGIQPSGTPHLGNYLGLFLPFLDLQKTSPASTPIYLSIVGLHAITLPRDPQQLREDRRDMLACLIAAGVDPERTCLYFQEDVPEHTELSWVLNTLCPVGRLQRMTTWKSQLATRSATSTDQVSQAELKLGLLAYPVLQAADILLYKSTLVPVGEDQTQHLELTRVIAETFNKSHAPIFPIPESMIVPSKRILNLRDPTAKMSKSHPVAASRILLTDTPTEITRKLKSATTDSTLPISFDPEARPGVANLLTIWSALDDSGRTPEQLAGVAGKEGWGMGKLKEVVGEVTVEKLRPVREEYEKIRKEHGYLSKVAKKGRETAGAKARKTMEEVRDVIGLNRI